MKVLITGCSSAQTSSSVAKKIPTFTGLLVQSLTEAGHEVVWDTPSMRLTEAQLSKYDTVVVGLTAPTSITAYRLYGALSVIDRAKSVTNLKYLVDAPEPHRLWNGIRAISQNPDDLVKDFYSRRSEFFNASKHKELERLQSVVEDLYKNNWNSTLVPSFPWFKNSNVTNHIPNLSDDLVEPLCLDSVTFKNLSSTGLYMKSDVSGWSYDTKTPWISKISKTLSREASPMVVSKTAGNSSVLSNLNKSIGSLISVYKNDEPWWSVNLAQSLFVKTPVISDWKHTSYLGESWSVLGHTVEDMSDSERVQLAISQEKDYKKAINTYEETLERVSSAIFND